MLANILRDTKSFLTSLTRGTKPCRLLKKNFPQPQERGARLVTVTNEPVSSPSTTSFAFSQVKNVFFKKLAQWAVLSNINVDKEKAKATPKTDIKANQFLDSHNKYNFGYVLIMKWREN